MNSADAWYEDRYQYNGERINLEALLGLSVEMVDTMNKAQREIEMEAAKERHPSGKAVSDVPLPGEGVITLNALDRCDAGCGAGALYRLAKEGTVLDFCHHHKAKVWPMLELKGWAVVGTNPRLMDELYNTNRLKGGDHA